MTTTPKPDSSHEKTEESTDVAQAFGELRAEFEQPDQILCWTQHLRKQDKRTEILCQGLTALGSLHGSTSDPGSADDPPT